MTKKSAGILLYRRGPDGVEVFLGHPGGPFYAKKDEGVWSIPKGEYEGEDAFEAAKREFAEETGHEVNGEGFELSPVDVNASKTVHAWAIEGDADPERITSNHFEMEWPPRSGKRQSFPEIDRAAWFSPEEARKKLHNAQVPFIDELVKKLEDE